MFSLLLLICSFIILKVCECNWPYIRTINAPASSTSTRAIETIFLPTTSHGITIWFEVTVDYFQQKIWGRLMWHFNWGQVFLPDCSTLCCWIHVSESCSTNTDTEDKRVKKWNWAAFEVGGRDWTWTLTTRLTDIVFDVNFLQQPKSSPSNGSPPYNETMSSSPALIIASFDIFSAVKTFFCLLLKIWIRLNFFLAQIVYLFQTTYLLCHIQSWNE